MKRINTLLTLLFLAFIISCKEMETPQESQVDSFFVERGEVSMDEIEFDVALADAVCSKEQIKEVLWDFYSTYQTKIPHIRKTKGEKFVSDEIVREMKEYVVKKLVKVGCPATGKKVVLFVSGITNDPKETDPDKIEYRLVKQVIVCIQDQTLKTPESTEGEKQEPPPGSDGGGGSKKPPGEGGSKQRLTYDSPEEELTLVAEKNNPLIIARTLNLFALALVYQSASESKEKSVAERFEKGQLLINNQQAWNHLVFSPVNENAWDNSRNTDSTQAPATFDFKSAMKQDGCVRNFSIGTGADQSELCLKSESVEEEKWAVKSPGASAFLDWSVAGLGDLKLFTFPVVSE